MWVMMHGHTHHTNTHTTHTLTFTYTYIHLQLNTSYLLCITLYACFRADLLILSDKLVYRSLRKDCISYSRHFLANCRTSCWVEALWSFLLACHYICCCFSLVHGYPGFLDSVLSIRYILLLKWTKNHLLKFNNYVQFVKYIIKITSIYSLIKLIRNSSKAGIFSFGEIIISSVL